MLDGHLGFELQEGAVPLIHGIARLAGMLYAGGDFGDLLDLIGPEPSSAPDRAAWLMDRSWAYSLNFAPYQAGVYQQQALDIQQVFRLRSTAAGPRLLALAAPGDLMVNAPLDFITEPAGLRLDLAFIGPGGALPAILPEHDVAMIAASESAPEALAGFARIFGLWPRPILNDPDRIAPMSRTWLPGRLQGLPGLITARARMVSRGDLAAVYPTSLLPGSVFPFLLRPLGSHAGHGLVRVEGPQDVQRFLSDTEGEVFTLTQFIDYRGANGWYCKYRIAFVAGRPFICHMAASEAWMVHYLNAGMDESPAKRAAEAACMLGTDDFTGRHGPALAALAEVMGLDYFSVDCAETKDGRLLVFEADTAAIIHSMDPPELYPYKREAMQRCYDAFGAMVRARSLECLARA
jgi:hypothetical protein